MSKVYALAKQVEQVQPSTSTEAWWLEILAVGKRLKSGGYQVWVPANEYISAVLGTVLGLPIPPFAMLEKRTSQGQESLWFASLDCRLAGESMAEIDPETVFAAMPDICFGIMLFDIWVANTDRHVENLSFDSSVSPKRLNVFDHSHALFGLTGPERLDKYKEGFILTSTVPTDVRPTKHCLLESVKDASGFAKWAERILEIPEFVVRDACENAHELGLIDEKEKNKVLEFLLFRRDNIKCFLTKNWDKFPNLQQHPIVF